jgi:hypothetical protein
MSKIDFFKMSKTAILVKNSQKIAKKSKNSHFLKSQNSYFDQKLAKKCQK